jgi:hypothetical protein
MITGDDRPKQVCSILGQIHLDMTQAQGEGYYDQNLLMNC